MDDSHFWLQTKVPKKTTTLIQRLVTSEANRFLGNAFLSIFQLGGPKRCFHWGVLNVPKNIVDGPMNI